jgi:hypothetical protein
MGENKSWRDRLSTGAKLASGAYRRTAGEIVQRRRSKAYMAREQAQGRTVSPLLPGRLDGAPVVPPTRAWIRSAQSRRLLTPEQARNLMPRARESRGRSTR